jgi:hypothetical protein
VTETPTQTPTITPTNTVTPTITPTRTATLTPTLTKTPTNTPTATCGCVRYTSTWQCGGSVDYFSVNYIDCYGNPQVLGPYQENAWQSGLQFCALPGQYTAQTVCIQFNTDCCGAPVTQTPTPSITPTNTPTSVTPTVTPTNTPTPSITPTNTVTPSVTPTSTTISSVTPTPTPTQAVNLYVLQNSKNQTFPGGTANFQYTSPGGVTTNVSTGSGTGVRLVVARAGSPIIVSGANAEIIDLGAYTSSTCYTRSVKNLSGVNRVLFYTNCSGLSTSITITAGGTSSVSFQNTWTGQGGLYVFP